MAPGAGGPPMVLVNIVGRKLFWVAMTVAAGIHNLLHFFLGQVFIVYCEDGY